MGTYDHKQTQRFAFIGMLGGFVCSIANHLPEYSGAMPNETMGAYGVIESAWAGMAAWRFPASVWIAAVAVPMYVLGFLAIIRQMRSTREKTGKLFGASALLPPHADQAVASCISLATAFLHTAKACFFRPAARQLTARRFSAIICCGLP